MFGVSVCHDNEWKLVYQFLECYQKQNYYFFGFEKPGCYSWYRSNWSGS